MNNRDPTLANSGSNVNPITDFLNPSGQQITATSFSNKQSDRYLPYQGLLGVANDTRASLVLDTIVDYHNHLLAKASKKNINVRANYDSSFWKNEPKVLDFMNNNKTIKFTNCKKDQISHEFITYLVELDFMMINTLTPQQEADIMSSVNALRSARNSSEVRIINEASILYKLIDGPDSIIDLTNPNKPKYIVDAIYKLGGLMGISKNCIDEITSRNFNERMKPRSLTLAILSFPISPEAR